MDLKAVLETVKQSIKSPSEKALIENIQLIENHGCITVSCPTPFVKKYIKKQYGEVFVKSIRAVIKKPVEINFDITGDKLANKDVQKKIIQMTLPPSQPAGITGLNSKYTFADFVVGDSNAFAYEAALAVSEDSIGKYNPLFFYSDIGLGKSHIAHAVGNRATGLSRCTKVKYTSALDFANEYMNAVTNNTRNKFRSGYSATRYNIVFIDDVHLLRNKEKTQIELSGIMDDLISTGTQVILAGFRPPTSNQEFDKGLVSRLASGLVINIKSPDRETRANIIQRKAEKEGIIIPRDVVDFISESIKTNIRDLESNVLTLTAISSLMKKNITLDLAKEILEGVLEKQARINIPFIQDMVSKNFGITKEQLVSDLRKKEIIYPRKVAIFLCKRFTDETLKNIGNAFGKKHTTIIHTLESMDDEYKNNIKTKKEIDFLIDKLDRK